MKADLPHHADQMLRSTRDMMQWQSPTERNRRSYADHLVNTKPTVERESSFIGRADDLVSLAGDLQNGWLTSQTGQWIHDLWPNLAAVSTPLEKSMLAPIYAQPGVPRRSEINVLIVSGCLPEQSPDSAARRQQGNPPRR